MSEDSIFPCLIACFLFALLGFALGIAFGTSQVGEKFEREAIKKGHAVWKTDENGHPVFQWKEASK
jgi:hypothetical protein